MNVSMDFFLNKFFEKRIQIEVIHVFVNWNRSDTGEVCKTGEETYQVL